jgi:hypothetical protein
MSQAPSPSSGAITTARARLGADFGRIAALLEDLAGERTDFTFVLA